MPNLGEPTRAHALYAKSCDSTEDPGLSSILSEGTEYMKEGWGGSSADYNSWVAETGQILDIDLGCMKTVNGFYLRNFHSGSEWKDGTKDLEITACDSTVFSACQHSKKYSLSQIDKASSDITEFIPLEEEIRVRFVRIRILSIYGERGGLHYFRENRSPIHGASYQGQFIHYYYVMLRRLRMIFLN